MLDTESKTMKFGQHNEEKFEHYWTLAEALEQAKLVPEITGSSHNERHRPSHSWDWSTGFEGAMDLAVNGWSEKAQELDRLALEYTNELHVSRPSFEFRFDVVGEEVDLGKYSAGNPECMLDAFLTKQDQLSNAVEVKVCTGMCSGVDAESFTRRGLFVFSVIRALELAGKSVGITTGSGTSNRGNHGEYWIRIKEPDQYINPGVLAFWLCHPAAHRRLMFRLKEHTSPTEVYAFSYNGGTYGATADSHQKIDKETIYYSSVHTQGFGKWDTPETMKEQIKQELVKQGIQFN